MSIFFLFSVRVKAELPGYILCFNKIPSLSVLIMLRASLLINHCACVIVWFHFLGQQMRSHKVPLPLYKEKN